jgi:hypothetical protein
MGMKNTGRLAAVVILLTISSCTIQRRPYYEYGGDRGNRDALSMQYFYDALSPYGNWVHNREYGYVWIPDVGQNFYPYATNGRWVATEYGWTWVSGYDWGWAAFHYGRWDYDDYYGWFWFPDDVWGPAWVTWREGDGYYGWAPMGPGSSMGMNVQSSYNDPYRWIFVRERDFGKGNIARYHVNPRKNIDIMRSSRVIDNAFTDNMGRSYNSGPDLLEVQRSTGRRINRVAVRDSDRPQTRLSSNQLEIYRPRIQRSADVTNRPAPSRITDIKDIRPMRERNRSYQPGTGNEEMREYTPNQGTRQNSDAEERARETRRQYDEKQGAMERRQEQVQSEQNQRSVEVEQSRPAQRRQAERRSQTDQQKRMMKKERETRRQVEADSTPSRRVEREVIARPRRR